MMALAAQLVIPLRADLAEGPVWHEPSGRLLCVDITAGRIHAYDFARQALRSIDTGAMVGCVAPRANGQLIAALAYGLAGIDLESARVTPLQRPPEHDATRCRFNDGKCDPQGRFWAGTMSLHGEAKAGTLYCFPTATESRGVLADVGISNGLAWNADGTTLYFIDSPTRRVDAFDFDGATGQLDRRRTVIVFPAGPAVPDGCTIDAEGMLWIAHWGGGCVTRWDPRRGTQLASVAVPAPHVTSCTFGGPGLETLYITTARRGLDPAALAASPESGSIFACHPGVRGVTADVFRG